MRVLDFIHECSSGAVLNREEGRRFRSAVWELSTRAVTVPPSEVSEHSNPVRRLETKKQPANRQIGSAADLRLLQLSCLARIPPRTCTRHGGPSDAQAQWANWGMGTTALALVEGAASGDQVPA